MSRSKEHQPPQHHYSEEGLDIDPVEVRLVVGIATAAQHWKRTGAMILAIVAVSAILARYSDQPTQPVLERPVHTESLYEVIEAESPTDDEMLRQAVKSLVQAQLGSQEKDAFGSSWDVVTTKPVSMQVIEFAGLRRTSMSDTALGGVIFAGDYGNRPVTRPEFYGDRIVGEKSRVFIVAKDEQTGEANHLWAVDMKSFELIRVYDGQNRLVQFTDSDGNFITATDLFRKASTPVQLKNPRNIVNL